MMFLVLHENIISELGVFAAMTAGTAIRAAVRLVRNIEHLAVGTAGTVLQSPPVILCGKIINMLFLKSGGQLKDIEVTKNSYVNAGDTIGSVAAPTKYFSVEGSNLYFELTKDGEPVNPENLF